ncbi:hypothetical protein D3C72_1398190 [compost metagenome]
MRGNTSAQNREGKSFEANAMVLGASTYSISQHGVNAAFFLARNSQIILNYSWGESDPCVADAFAVCKAKDSSYGVFYKQFFGNSFYLLAGVDHHNLQYSKKYDDLFEAYEVGFDATVTAANILIGNQWSWNSFTMGVDWFGLALPLAYSISNGYYSGTDGQVEYEDKVGQYEGRGGGYALRFYVGASF